MIQLISCGFSFSYDKNPRISEGIRALANIRYSGAKIELVKLVTQEPDKVSSGILSVAYATAIIFGQDPAQLLMKIDEGHENKTQSLREHFRKILAEKQLEMFPSEVYDEVWEEMRRGELYSDRLWAFMEIVANVTNYTMINPILHHFPENFERPQNETHLDDLQIFYGENHYACLFFNASIQTVFMYDIQFC